MIILSHNSEFIIINDVPVRKKDVVIRYVDIDRIEFSNASTEKRLLYSDRYFEISIDGVFYDKKDDLSFVLADLLSVGVFSSDTGFESAYLNATQAITANTDTVLTIAGSVQTQNGNIDLIDLANNVITPEFVDDVLMIDISLPFVTPAGTNNYVSLILRVKTTGQIYRGRTHSMLKGSGNQDFLTASWGVPINADAQANGLEIIINSNVNFTISQKFVSVTRVHKVV